MDLFCYIEIFLYVCYIMAGIIVYNKKDESHEDSPSNFYIGRPSILVKFNNFCLSSATLLYRLCNL